MGLDQRAFTQESNNEVEGFYWRKHARLQVFMNREHKEQHGDNNNGAFDLGFNAGDEPVAITEDVCNKLEKAIENKYMDFFASDGFFWGQQFQEEAVNEYREQDKKFLSWAREQIKQNKKVFYDCSW